MNEFLVKFDSVLCRQKIVVPSDTRKKNLANCGIALQYLRQAGVMLYDEDGMMIVEEDIVQGDKELTLSLLWNIFVHLQVCRFLFSDPNFHESWVGVSLKAYSILLTLILINFFCHETAATSFD